MGKKIKKVNSKISYQSIIDNIQEKNYREAAFTLRKTKFPPQEKKKVDDLNIKIHYFWALDYFDKKDYRQAITTLRMFVERFKKKINLPLEKTNMLLGLSYFYTNDLEKAATYLISSKDKAATYPFYFYYLLVLIYQKKYSDIITLFAEHEKQLEMLQEHQKKYLAIAFALVQSDFGKAKILLNEYSAVSEYQDFNIAALKAILNDGVYKQKTTSLKALYKSFLKVELTAEDKQYLATLPQLEQQTKGLKNNQLINSLKEPLQTLCKDGQALTREEFEKCMEMPEEYRPFIVYNQIAALFNDDIEETEAEILAILKKQEWVFFQIPEAVFLFAQIAYWEPNNFTTTFFWRSLESSLDRFGSSFTPLQLNRLSWRILSCLEDSGFSRERVHDRKQVKLTKAFPQMLGLKWWQITNSIGSPDVAIPETALDIFTYANFQYGKDIILGSWESSLDNMYPSPEIISMFYERAMSEYMASPDIIENFLIEAFEQIIHQAQETLTKITIEKEVHLKNRVVLDLFKLTHHYMAKFEREKKILLNKSNKEAFFKAYYDIIVLFEENKPDSQYLQDYQLLENTPKIRQLAGAMDGSKTKLIKLFKQHISEGEDNIIHQALIDDLLITYNIEESINKVAIYFNVLTNQVAEEKLKVAVQQFGNIYVQRLRLPHIPKYPDTNFFTLLEQLMLVKPNPAYILTIAVLTDIYTPYLTKEVEPLYYNTAEELLNYFIKAQKKYPDFNYNKGLIQKLMAFIKIAVEKRKLKGLAKSLAIAKKIFD